MAIFSASGSAPSLTTFLYSASSCNGGNSLIPAIFKNIYTKINVSKIGGYSKIPNLSFINTKNIELGFPSFIKISLLLPYNLSVEIHKQILNNQRETLTLFTIILTEIASICK